METMTSVGEGRVVGRLSDWAVNDPFLATMENHGGGRTGLFRRRVPSPSSEVFDRIEESINYMARHLDQPLQVATLAARANFSQSHYFALFKRHTGCAPMDYFTRLRMERARRLLDSTGSSVKEVAAMLGYEDPFYFSRVFKSTHGIAPSQYRATNRETSGDEPNSFRPRRFVGEAVTTLQGAPA